MIIDLPRKFSTEATTRNKAFIKRGVLKFNRNCNFLSLMYQLTYSLKNDKICPYCGRRMEQNEMTLDHIYPRDLGGPTITNNLLPCCKECNSKKGNLTKEQFLNMLLAEQKGNEEKYLRAIRKQQEELRKRGEYELPSMWVEKLNIREIQDLYSPHFNYRKTKMYNSIKEYYARYGILKRPILLDRNMIILDEILIYLFAKDRGVKKIPVIILDNVKVL